MPEKKFIEEIEKAKEGKVGRPSVGPVYRNVLVKEGSRPLAQGLESCWDIFRESVKKYPNHRMLGECEIVNGKACNAHGLYCVPLYDTLGAGAVKYIICHAELSLVFVEENKISKLTSSHLLPLVLKTFPNTQKYLKTLVSFGKVTLEQEDAAGNFGVKLYSWNDFSLLGLNKKFDIPIKKKTDICTIMYTSGTTGDPTGVMISNESILSIVSGVNHHLESMNEEFSETDVYLSYLPLEHIFDQVIEELFMWKGASIGFWHKDIKQLIDDIKELKPTVLCSTSCVRQDIFRFYVNSYALVCFSEVS